MKILLLLIATALGGIIFLPLDATASRNDYIKEEPQAKPGESVPVCSTEAFADLPVDCWKSERVLFIPAKELKEDGYYMVSSSPTETSHHPNYEALAGKTGRITGIENNKPWDSFFRLEITMDGTAEQFYYVGTIENKKRTHLDYITFIRDIDAARKQYLGKKLWVGTKQVYVSEIVASTDRYADPVRFIVKDKEGNIEHYDVAMSKTNGLRDVTFNKVFSTEDPAIIEAKKAKARIEVLKARFKKYNWSKKVWDHIAKGEVCIGMSKVQASLSWGEPVTINTTTGVFGRHEQWVYSHNNYLYFENGKLTTIQH